MTKFTKEFLIPYYDTDPKGVLRPEIVLSYMAETSSWHSDSLGVGHKLLNASGYGWMLNRWEAEFIELPKAKEKAIVKTWTSSFDRFYATREFNMEDERGNLLVKASTQWIFLDMKKKRPIRIPMEIQVKYSFIEEHGFDGYTDLKPFEAAAGRTITTRKSDIDNNNHVNNIRYIEWMLEKIPDEVSKDKKLKRLAVNYKKEVLLGDTIRSILTTDTVSGDRFFHLISVDGETNALGMTEWK